MPSMHEPLRCESKRPRRSLPGACQHAFADGLHRAPCTYASYARLSLHSKVGLVRIQSMPSRVLRLSAAPIGAALWVRDRLRYALD